MAVVLIFGLLAAVVLPSLGVRTSRALHDQATRLAADLELARERTIMTGIPHRVLLDLDGAAYRVEWLVTEAEALGEEPAADAAPLDLSSRERLDLSPPRGETPEFRPLPNEFGRVSVLNDEVAFAAVETARERIERGAVSVGFDADGTAEATAITLTDVAGRKLVLDIATLDELVRIRSADS